MPRASAKAAASVKAGRCRKRRRANLMSMSRGFTGTSASKCPERAAGFRLASVERILPGVPQDVEPARHAIDRVHEALLVYDGVVDLGRPVRIFRRRRRHVVPDLLDAGRRAGQGDIDQPIDPDAAVEEGSDERVLEVRGSW